MPAVRRLGEVKASAAWPAAPSAAPLRAVGATVPTAEEEGWTGDTVPGLPPSTTVAAASVEAEGEVWGASCPIRPPPGTANAVAGSATCATCSGQTLERSTEASAPGRSHEEGTSLSGDPT